MAEKNCVAAAVAETCRVLKQLRDLIEDSDTPLLSLERRLAFSRGYLSQILNGYIELKYWHMTAILDELGVAPGEFLAELFPSRLPHAGPANLEVSQDMVVVYGIGIETVRELRQRTLECERRLIDLRESGELERLITSAGQAGRSRS